MMNALQCDMDDNDFEPTEDEIYELEEDDEYTENDEYADLWFSVWERDNYGCH